MFLNSFTEIHCIEWGRGAVKQSMACLFFISGCFGNSEGFTDKVLVGA